MKVGQIYNEAIDILMMIFYQKYFVLLCVYRNYFLCVDLIWADLQ